MAVFKCKMCGGSLAVSANESVGVCEFCGVKQTLPKLDSERKSDLYERAGHFRRNNDYDKAMLVYEKILDEDRTDAESYWSIVLCRYGIEYVEDPVNHTHIPTVNRTQYTSIFDDEDYKAAIANADEYQRHIYEEEAEKINEIQKEILAISSREEPFDIFICYKETDASGRRTPDSVLATEMYHSLTSEGYKVFFARITLEDKLGQEYEPYIFAAVNSASVMIVLGTRPDYFNSVWVKNEWSRFLAQIKKGEKKTLIPAFRDMNPYDLPEEFSLLQAQDMGKLGFMQDIIHGIKKIIPKDNHTDAAQVSAQEKLMPGVSSLIKRCFLFIEDGEWSMADKYAEKILDIDPECADAYLCKLLISLKLRSADALAKQTEAFGDNPMFVKARRYANGELKKMLLEADEAVNARIKNENNKSLYDETMRAFQKADNVNALYRVRQRFEALGDFMDCPHQLELCKRKIEKVKEADRKSKYDTAISFMEQAYALHDLEILSKSMIILEDLGNWGDAKRTLEECKALSVKLTERAKRINKIKLIVFASIVIGIVLFMAIFSMVNLYRDAAYGERLLKDGEFGSYVKYEEIKIFEVPEGVTAIDAFEFSNCTTLETVKLPDSIERIGMSAFAGCTSLENVTFAEGVKEVGVKAFVNCTSLKSITLPEGLETVSEYAFSGCTQLREVYFPKSVKTIGTAALGNCPSLITLEIPFVGKSANISGSGLNLFGYLFGSSSYSGGIRINQKYSENSSEAYYIPSGLSRVAVLGGQIHYGSFYDCVMLKEVIIGDDVTTVGDFAFSGCSGLRYLTIGKGVETIGDRAFRFCSQIKKIRFNAVDMQDCEEDSYVFFGAGKNFDTGITVAISSSVKRIPARLFEYMGADSANISEIQFEANSQCTSIGEDAFCTIGNLKSITIPQNVKTLFSNSIRNDESRITVYCEAGSKPEGWDDNWAQSTWTVVWGYTGES